ncbi:hypothetical protein K474DRAFT_1587777 [Panus rudis PR-1116 ss-1]|nr:hypothetical protein K474DRAFT_1587777 [Panus rudis PR-1116 ss-1]
MSFAVEPIVELYRYVLQPIAPFTWLGLSISTLDVAAAFRLCIALRQIKEKLYVEHKAKLASASASGEKGSKVEVKEFEERSFVRDVSATLLVVYGGEAVTSPLLGTPPSFMISGVVPALYTAIQAIVERLPSVPMPSLNNELPLAFMDGISRAYLLCNLIPPVVLNHTLTAVNTSPWTLLLTSLLTANSGFFFIGLFSFLHPYSLTLTTPTEFLPYGWTTTDLWCAPLITGLYALLTHAQPFWADAHTTLFGWLQGQGVDALTKQVAPVDPEVARAICAVVLAAMFSTRAVKNFGAGAGIGQDIKMKKVKAQ